MRWCPLSVRNDPSADEAYDALHDGVPEWLREGITDWTVRALKAETTYLDDLEKRLQALEQALRFPLRWIGGAYSATQSVINEIHTDGPLALDIVNHCLMLTKSFRRDWALREDLDAMLARGGSAWTVATDVDIPCLHRRVDEVTEAAARAEMTAGGNPALHLRASWDKVFGRNPDPSGGYREAVRAVEAAAKPVIAPRDASATLGKMIRALRDKPSKWATEIGSPEVVANMMDAMWTSQLDRHGTDDESVPLAVSPAQAEAAVHMATTLVQWFRRGAIRIA